MDFLKPTGGLAVASMVLGFLAKHVLSLAIASPLLGAVIAFFSASRHRPRFCAVGFSFSLIPLVLWGYLFTRFRGIGGFEFSELIPWMRTLHVDYWFGLDGISFFLFGLTSLLMPPCIFWDMQKKSARRSSTLLLLILQAALLGAFAALDFFLFYLFVELGVIAFYFLAGLPGTRGTVSAARSFLFFNLLGSACWVWVMARLYGLTGHSLGLAELVNLPLSQPVQTELLGIFFLGVLLKSGLFPAHYWLTQAALCLEAAPRVLLLALLTKLGLYALWRFLFPIAPLALLQWAPTIKLLGMVGLLYGAVLSVMVKGQLRESYWVLAHLSLIVLILSGATITTTELAVYHMIQHGSFFALWIFASHELRAVGLRAPIWFALSLLALIALAGFPGSNGFLGFFMSLQEAWGVGAASGVILMITWFILGISCFQVLLELSKPIPLLEARRGAWRRALLITPLLCFIVIGAIQPGWYLGRTHAAVAKLLAHFNENRTDNI